MGNCPVCNSRLFTENAGVPFINFRRIFICASCNWQMDVEEVHHRGGLDRIKKEDYNRPAVREPTRKQNEGKQCKKCKIRIESKYDLCYNCYSGNNKTEVTKDKVRFPSHSEFYKHLPKIKYHLLAKIFRYLQFEYYQEPKRKTLFGKSLGENHGLLPEKTTEATMVVEASDGWDILFLVQSSPDEFIRKVMKKHDLDNFYIYIEYKSSINEWGKQVDAYIRQIKKRTASNGVIILLSFDPAFKEYEEVLAECNVNCIVLDDKEYKDWIKVTEDLSDEERMKQANKDYTHTMSLIKQLIEKMKIEESN